MDQTLPELNAAIEDALRDYVPSADYLEIRFDIPDEKKLPTIPTISVFLYQVEEDLEMRVGESRKYNAGSGQLIPRVAHVRCSYLITYWDGATDEASRAMTGPRSQSVEIMDQVLYALLHNRELRGMPNSYSRVMPPEHLNTLGQFWQALGNKPRLCLKYDVTVRVTLGDRVDEVSPVRTIDARIAQKSAVDIVRQAEVVFRRKLRDGLIDEGDGLSDEMRIQIENLRFDLKLIDGVPGNERAEDAAYFFNLSGSGALEPELHARVVSMIQAWSGSDIGEVGGKALTLNEVDIGEIVRVDDISIDRA
ncbi:Pvc16 family protein [Burkholderia sp. MSMB1589WGS]|uniref:Pvc16 family protein n=1 Tax=Burkholderia sp. MSMB1589WGS TaxID=1636425 RepID=UPI0009ED8412|nr:Pvc16 family protein [Burkholderia sp. MSMB1589WGS]